MSKPCEFCGINGHNIRQCISEEITYIYYMINERLLQYLQYYSYYNILDREYYLECDILRRYTKSTYKAILYKYTTIACSNLNKKQLLQCILNHMFSNNIIIPRPPQNHSLFYIFNMNYDSFDYVHVESPQKIKYNIKIDLEEEIPEPDTTFECAICLTTMKDSKSVTLNCNHVFCGECIEKSIKHTTKCLCCALCRTNITNFDTKSCNIYDNLLQYCM
jgi:Ring finger domain